MQILVGQLSIVCLFLLHQALKVVAQLRHSLKLIRFWLKLSIVGSDQLFFVIYIASVHSAVIHGPLLQLDRETVGLLGLRFLTDYFALNRNQFRRIDTPRHRLRFKLLISLLESECNDAGRVDRHQLIAVGRLVATHFLFE
jgi:hypothetical protein